MRFIALVLSIALIGCNSSDSTPPTQQLKKTTEVSVDSDTSKWSTQIVYFSEFHSEIPYQLSYNDSMHYSITLNDIDEMIDYRITELRTNRVIDTVFTFQSPAGKMNMQLYITNCPMNGQLQANINLWKNNDEVE